jgi:teichuronic acid biosynthesis glycosyltransferase TuaG
MVKDLKNQQLISIIMPAYNAERFISEAILSVIAQTYNHWELIVIDDGSVDHTGLIVIQLQQTDKRIIYRYQANQKLGCARNTGLLMASGEWIGFLDSDDLWLENKLEQQVKIIDSTNADVIFSEGFFYDDKSQELTPYTSLHGWYKASAMYNALMLHNSIPVLSVLIRKTLVNRIGLQDTNRLANGCEDWDYWLRASLIDASFYGITKLLCQTTTRTCVLRWLMC